MMRWGESEHDPPRQRDSMCISKRARRFHGVIAQVRTNASCVGRTWERWLLRWEE